MIELHVQPVPYHHQRCVFSPGTPVSSTKKTNLHDVAEILLKVALNTINQTKPMLEENCHQIV
jgi:hypothetical protein